MFYYQLFGMILESDIEFPQLIKAKESESDIQIKSGKIPENIYAKEAQGCRYGFGKEISWLANSYCYIYVEKGKQITYQLKENGTVLQLRNYLMGWGMSMLGLQKETIAMHCSVIASDEGAILISGESGSGKSTLTNAFLSDGWKFMADDMAYVKTKEGGEVVVYPAFPYQKLCRDAALRKGYNLDELIYLGEEKDKFFVPYQGDFVTHEMPVKALVVLMLAAVDEVSVSEITGMNKFMACANNLFLRHLLKQDRYTSVAGQESFRMAEGI